MRLLLFCMIICLCEVVIVVGVWDEVEVEWKMGFLGLVGAAGEWGALGLVSFVQYHTYLAFGSQ